MKTSTESITTRITDALGFLSENGFRYFKSYYHFRRKDASGYSYITINVTTRNRITYSLAFYVGTRVDPLENAIASLRSDDSKLDHYSRSTSTYTVNVGPDSHGWACPVWGNWLFQSDDEVAAAIPQVSSFIRNTMLPFINTNTTAEGVRQTLLNSPGKTQNLMPHHQIFTADVLSGDQDRLVADHAILDERYRKFIERSRIDFDQFYALCRERLAESKA